LSWVVEPQLCEVLPPKRPAEAQAAAGPDPATSSAPTKAAPQAAV
jgi:hypothetical protein